MEIIQTKEREVIERFLAHAGSSLSTFRYFRTRPTSIISNHLITLVGKEGNDVVAYGHLDPDGGKTWLGVCVADEWKGEGRGTAIVAALLEEADKNGIDVSLTVDEGNARARSIYERLGFKNARCISTTVLYYERSKRG
jgi:GNAT superfamily N-acetyltransferase